MAVATTGERIIFLSSLGSTETAPAALARTWESDAARQYRRADARRGAEARAERRQARSAATGGRTSRRATGGGPTSPRKPSTTKASTRWATRSSSRTPAIPARACVFDGRLAEDFKLASGTWVSAGALRAQFIDHCAPLVRDAVIAGLNRDDIAALVFPDVEACRKLAGIAADAPAAAVLADAKVRDEFKKRLNALARQSTGGSTRICRIDPDGRAAVARRRRSHRQGLDQPARGADPPRRAGRGAVRGPRRLQTSSQSRNGNKPHGPQRTRRHRHRSRLRARRRDRGAARRRPASRSPASTSTSTARRRRRRRSAASPSAATSPAPTTPRPR